MTDIAWPEPNSYSKRSFAVRRMNGVYQVYAMGLRHICICDTKEEADDVADFLDQWGEEIFGRIMKLQPVIKEWNGS